MEKFDRKPLSELPSLTPYEGLLQQYCNECLNGTRQWRSSGNLYNLLRNELKYFTKGHCSFCDGYPLKVTSKETIEHYFPKKTFPEKTYQWENLYYSCDQCQIDANAIAFEETIKPDSLEYQFDKYFYFDPQSGKILVLENLEKSNIFMFQKAEIFLVRYGINNDSERCQTRKTLYIDCINLLKTGELGEIDFRPYRAVVKAAVRVFKTLPFI